MARLEKKLGALQAPKANAQTLLEVETKCMDTIKETLLAKRDAVLDELRSYLHAPAATWHVLKAIFRLLKREEDLGKSWRQALGVLNADLFNDLAKFDIKTDHDSASWKAVRCAYKAAGGPAAALKQWQYEMPKSCAGAFLMLFIRQVCPPFVHHSFTTHYFVLLAIWEGTARATVIHIVDPMFRSGKKMSESMESE